MSRLSVGSIVLNIVLVGYVLFSGRARTKDSTTRVSGWEWGAEVDSGTLEWIVALASGAGVDSAPVDSCIRYFDEWTGGSEAGVEQSPPRCESTTACRVVGGDRCDVGEEPAVRVAILFTLTESPLIRSYVQELAVAAFAWNRLAGTSRHVTIADLLVSVPASVRLHPDDERLLDELGIVRLSLDVPVRWSELSDPYYASHVNESGCCGLAELTKLQALTLSAYDWVLVSDADTLPYRLPDELFVAPPSVGFIYTNGSMVGEHMSGGVFALRPNRTLHSALVDVVRVGDFEPGKGWGGTGVGWGYGGATIQGLLPYWFLTKEAPARSMRVSRCVYNSQNARECTDTPLDAIALVHFTLCGKPARCEREPRLPACLVHFDTWWRVSRDLEASLALPARPSCSSLEAVASANTFHPFVWASSEPAVAGNK